MSNRQEKINVKYQQLVDTKVPKPNLLVNCSWAFFVGGTICVIGELIHNIIEPALKSTHMITSNYTTLILVFIGSFLTGLGVYDVIGKRAGAGSVIPITGFANSIVAPAMEFKKEGFIFGVAAKMFILAGPVLVYGIGSSIIVGLIYYMFK